MSFKSDFLFLHLSTDILSAFGVFPICSIELLLLQVLLDLGPKCVLAVNLGVFFTGHLHCFALEFASVDYLSDLLWDNTASFDISRSFFLSLFKGHHFDIGITLVV